MRCWRGKESDVEIAFITDLAAEQAYEEYNVKDLLQELFSSVPASSRMHLNQECASAEITSQRPTASVLFRYFGFASTFAL